MVYMGVKAAKSEVAARVRRVAEEVVDQEAKDKESEAAAHHLGDEVIPEGNDGAARTGQDPPVQAGRQESTKEEAEGREAERR